MANYETIEKLTNPVGVIRLARTIVAGDRPKSNTVISFYDRGFHPLINSKTLKKPC